MSLLRYAWQSLGREWRSGELRVLAIALVIAVAAVTSVGFYTDRVQRAINLQAAELLAADLSISSSQPLDAQFAQEAQRLGLSIARYVAFPSVVVSESNDALAELKAVSAGWPLRGQARISAQEIGDDRQAEAGPSPGEAWVEARLLALLDVQLGDRIWVGDAPVTVTHVLTYEPDRGGDVFQLAPRLMFSLEDLPATELLGPGSRVSHRFLLAGDEAAIAAYRSWAEPRLASGQRLEGVSDARPELRVAITRGEQFLGLAALMSVLLAGAAVAVAARHYSERQADTSAIMRCLGATQRFVLQVFILRVLMLAVMASGVGLLLGFAAQNVLARLLAGWFTLSLPLPSLTPVFTGLAVGILTAVGFALPALLRLGQVPPLRVLRRDLGAPPPAIWLVLLLALGTLGGLLLWQSGDPRLAGWVLAGAAVMVAILWGVAWLMVRLLAPLRSHGGIALRFGLANLSRRGALSAVQLSAFGLGIMALLLLALVRVDLLANWEQSLPEDAPNHFMINVQPDQVEPLRELFLARGLEAPVYYPMIRGRYTRNNEEPVRPEQFSDPRAERLVNREFNLSVADRDLQADNRIVAGQWWTQQPDQPGWSVEEGLADTLGIALGDVLEFSVAGERISAPVTSLRSVEWDSFNVNFFVLASPGLLDEQPATFITSFHLDEASAPLLRDAIRQFPSITVLDVRALMNQVRDIMDRATLAVEYVFLFTLAAGLTVLFAAIQSTRQLRRRESAILRTLGAARLQVIKGLVTEFAVMGGLAGLLASLGATVVGMILAAQIFDLPYRPDPLLWVIGIGGGAVGIALAGWLGTRSALRQPPLSTLGQGQ